MRKHFKVIFFLFLVSCSQHGTRNIANDRPELPMIKLIEMVELPSVRAKLRSGYSMEQTNLKGCVLFLEGLADSFQNHQPFFNYLNTKGYRILFFDYLGQGGSEGSMNKTRLRVEQSPRASAQLPAKLQNEIKQSDHEHRKYFEISHQADFFWERYRQVKNNFGQDCVGSKKIIMGWSTGGLAAYSMAEQKRLDALILIAPGIHTKFMIGESAERWDKMLTFRRTISEATLTRNKFENTVNPHIDPIKPTSPSHVPNFAVNLLVAARHSAKWKIDPSIAGIVFLSGTEDTYVDRDLTLRTLSKNASHFQIQSYDGALHEIDNEIPEVTTDMYSRTVRFLDSVTAK